MKNSHTLPRLAALAAALLLTVAAHAAAPLRLYEISASRFVERAPGELWLERGLLNALGSFRQTDASPVLSSVTVPVEARNKTLIGLEAWFAYTRLGPEAVINFVADEDSPSYTIGARQYMRVTPNGLATVDDGKLVNLASRGYASTGQKLIGGFVVDEQHRWVLIRAVGPGLSALGVTDAMPDPYLTIFRGTTILHYNGDWSTRYDSAAIAAAAAKVGAFPLSTNSKDAALLVQLQPGAYTAHVEPENGPAGNVLLEIYTVPSAGVTPESTGQN